MPDPKAPGSGPEELIAALERATGPDRELDEAIQAFLVGATPEKLPDGRTAYHRDGFWVYIGPILPRTSSIDAALTLVPEDYRWLIDCRAGAKSRSDGYRAHVWLGVSPSYESTKTWSPSPAIALTLAALKARLAAQ